jgi:hypothetical protein
MRRIPESFCSRFSISLRAILRLTETVCLTIEINFHESPMIGLPLINSLTILILAATCLFSRLLCLT